MTETTSSDALRRLMSRLRRSLNYRAGRLQSRIMCELKERRLPATERTKQQVASFASVDLDRSAGLHAIDAALSACGLGRFSEDDDMFSEHLVLLAALSHHIPTAKNVLEIGTYDGRTALILSKLFANAVITTIDLPPSDPVYADSYEVARSDSFVRRRNEYLHRESRISFIEMNSLRLTEATQTANYDAIWVDGDHDFPVVGVDISNAVRLLRPGGYLLCDDVVVDRPSQSTTYLSDAAHRTLSAMHGAGLIDKPTYVYKRLGKRHQHPRKFVAITRTRATNQAN